MLNHQAQKVVAVAYRRWSFTTGSNCKALTGKISVFWIGGHLWEVVTYKSWSHIEVRLLSTEVSLLMLELTFLSISYLTEEQKLLSMFQKINPVA